MVLDLLGPTRGGRRPGGNGGGQWRERCQVLGGFESGMSRVKTMIH